MKCIRCERELEPDNCKCCPNCHGIHCAPPTILGVVSDDLCSDFEDCFNRKTDTRSVTNCKFCHKPLPPQMKCCSWCHCHCDANPRCEDARATVLCIASKIDYISCVKCPECSIRPKATTMGGLKRLPACRECLDNNHPRMRC